MFQVAWSANFQALTETRTCTLTLVTGKQSIHGNHYTTHCPILTQAVGTTDSSTLGNVGLVTGTEQTAPYLGLQSKLHHILAYNQSKLHHILAYRANCTISWPTEQTAPYLGLQSEQTAPYLGLQSEQTAPYLGLQSEQTAPYLGLQSTFKFYFNKYGVHTNTQKYAHNLNNNLAMRTTSTITLLKQTHIQSKQFVNLMLTAIAYILLLQLQDV